MGEFSCIVLDLEWNQPLDAGGAIREPFFFDSEIIEIGALKLNAQLEVVDEFKTFIRPAFYPVMNGDVVRLTKIRPQELEGAPDFPAAYRAFRDWCGEECCLCAWGTDDIPVLLDNLIMHGLETEDFPCYDLQRIFGHEILREERQCSLERAMELLGIRPDRAHDALNDARNTVRVMERMDLAACMEEYTLRYVGYPADRRAGLVDGREFASLAAAQADPEMGQCVCPYCGETVALREWTRRNNYMLLGYGQCSEEDEFCASLRRVRAGGGVRVSRTVFEMNDDLWDTYQDCLERGGTAAE